MDDKDLEFLKKMNALYKGGHFKEVIEQIIGEYPDLTLAPVDILVRLGWAYYKLYNLDFAEKYFRMAHKKDLHYLRAAEGLAQVAAARGDEDAVSRFNDFYPGSQGTCNALMSMAAKPKSHIPLEKVIAAAKRHMATPGLTTNNILLHAGKALVYRGSTTDDYLLAIAFLNTSLLGYGKEGYWDHRADAWGFISRAYDSLGIAAAALTAAQESCDLWVTQLAAQVTSEFVEKRDAAFEWRDELLGREGIE